MSENVCFFILSNIKFYTMSVSYMTPEGYEKLKSELEVLKTKGREDVAKAIAEAREKGDLSENAEYDAAKNAQGMLELKINDMEKVFATARIIDESQLDTSKVTVLTNVTIMNMNNKAEVTYKLVAEAEANLKEKKISVSSPIGQGLLGKAVGDTAQIQTPAGLINFKIIKISL
jgi:transcription elongation factor GreA